MEQVGRRMAQLRASFELHVQGGLGVRQGMKFCKTNGNFEHGKEDMETLKKECEGCEENQC